MTYRLRRDKGRHLLHVRQRSKQLYKVTYLIPVSGWRNSNRRPVATQRCTVVSLSALSLIINEPVVTIFRRQRAVHKQSSNSGKVAQPVQKSQMDERRVFSGVKSIVYAEGAGTHAGEQSAVTKRRCHNRSSSRRTNGE